MSKKLSRLILVAVIILQCCAMLYWASRKVHYYTDELYTFEYAQNIKFRKGKIEYMFRSPQWKEGEWMSVGDLKTRFTVEKWESVLELPFSKSVNKFFQDRNYMWIINVLESLFGKGEAPKWICIFFNMAVWILFQFLLFYFLARCLGVDRGVALMAVAMWGFCPLVLGLAVFCRFYSWTLLLFLVSLVFHKLMWDGRSHMRNLAYEAVAFLSLYLAFKNSELIFVSGGALILFFTVGLVARRRYVQSLYYFIPVAGLALLTPGIIRYVSVILHPSAHTATEPGELRSVVAKHADFLLTSSWSDKAGALADSVKMFGESVFGSWILLVVALVCLVILFFTARRKVPARRDGFVLVMLGVAFVFWVFCGICGLMKTRYYSFMFFLGAVLFWVAFDRVIRLHRIRGFIRGAAVCLVIAMAALPFFRRNVEYVYDGWQPVFEKFDEYKGTDSLVDYRSLFILYQSVYRLDSSASIYPIKGHSAGFFLSKSLPDLPPTFLYWTDITVSDPVILNKIRFAGYSASEIIEWGITRVYVCRKKGDV